MTDPESFFRAELEAWPLAAENFINISEASDKAADLGDRTTWKLRKIHINHRRASVTAKIDAASIAARPCFLCASNRPVMQGFIGWDDYQILVNPYPLAPRHFTIAFCSHKAQSISGRIPAMARLTQLFQDLCVFYNGPLCGASAPDHLHFQAVSKEIAANIFDPDLPLQQICSDSDGTLYRSTPKCTPFPFFIIESAEIDTLDRIFTRLWESLPPAEPEPMVNLAMVMTDNGMMRLFVVPRRRHRPQCYGQGENGCLISPATIEMLGTLVCSRREDFDRLDQPLAEAILAEVALDEDSFKRIVESLKLNNPTL